MVIWLTSVQQFLYPGNHNSAESTPAYYYAVLQCAQFLVISCFCISGLFGPVCHKHILVCYRCDKSASICSKSEQSEHDQRVIYCRRQQRLAHTQPDTHNGRKTFLHMYIHLLCAHRYMHKYVCMYVGMFFVVAKCRFVGWLSCGTITQRLSSWQTAAPTRLICFDE